MTLMSYSVLLKLGEWTASRKTAFFPALRLPLNPILSPVFLRLNFYSKLRSTCVFNFDDLLCIYFCLLLLRKLIVFVICLM